jgi:Flp pilus assembly protein CpaB
MLANKKKVVVGGCCVAAALIVAFGAAPVYNNTVNKTVTVVRAKTNISQGTKITPSMVETVTVGAKNLPKGTETDISCVTGRYAKTNISSQDFVTETKIQEKSESMVDGKQLISIPIKSLAAGLNGNIQAGDIVSLYGVRSESSKTEANTAETPVEFKYLQVFATSVSVSSDGSSNSNEMTLTLYASPKQAASLAGWDSGTIYVSLVSRGDANKAQRLLTEQKKLIDSETSALTNK